jgi:ribonuclease-3
MMQELQQRIGYAFDNPELLTLALTHPSLGKGGSNQRLEFLGDAVLGMAVAAMLYDLYPSEQEGELARRHAALVRGETLTQIAAGIGLGDCLLMAASEKQGGGRDNASNLEDALEALIGAIYLDGGMEAAQRFIAPRWRELAEKIIAPPKDAKTALQEWAQARGLAIPVYRIVETTGPAHAPVFTIEVSLAGHAPATAKAASKRLAEQLAAEALLKKLMQNA